MPVTTPVCGKAAGVGEKQTDDKMSWRERSADGGAGGIQEGCSPWAERCGSVAKLCLPLCDPMD